MSREPNSRPSTCLPEEIKFERDDLKKLLTVTCAGRPPVGRSVDNWITCSLRMILIGKRVNPSNHLGRSEAVTFIAAIGVVL